MDAHKGWGFDGTWIHHDLDLGTAGSPVNSLREVSEGVNRREEAKKPTIMTTRLIPLARASSPHFFQ